MPLSFVRHDITKLATDAIVNAANVDLLPGGGVCGAIFGAAGYEAMNDACRRIGHVDTGAAVATPGFALPARYVIHTAGPVWRGGTQGEEELLASCYRSSLVLAAELGCRSIAFPLISAGIYGYPRGDAFAVAVSAIRAYLVDDPDMEVTLCLFDRGATTLAEGLFGAVQHYIDDSFVESSPYQRRVLEGQYSTLLEGPAPSAPAAPVAPPSVTPLEASSDSPALDTREAAASTKRPVSDARAGEARHDAQPKKGRGIKQLFQSAADALRPEGSRRFEGKAVAEANSVMLSEDLFSPEETGALPPLDELLLHLDASFADTLLAMIDERGLSDAEVYGRANLSRQYFSKLRSGQVNPSKRVVCALAVALGLTLDETTLLLERAGHALTHASRFDIIVEWFILQGSYDVFEINQALFRFDQPLLGTS